MDTVLLFFVAKTVKLEPTIHFLLVYIEMLNQGMICMFVMSRNCNVM